MTFNQLEQANRISLHDLINTSLLPNLTIEMGQREEYIFRNARVRVSRMGNAYGIPTDARSYTYRIRGEGFETEILAVAEANCIRISLKSVDDPIYLNCWLRGLDPEEGYDEAAALAAVAS